MIKKILVLFSIFIIFSPIYAQNYSDGQYIATTEIRINHHFCPASMKSKIRFKINGNKVIGRISSKDKDEYNNKCCLMSLNRGFFGTLSSNGYLQTSSNRNSCSDWAKITGYIKNELFLTIWDDSQTLYYGKISFSKVNDLLSPKKTSSNNSYYKWELQFKELDLVNRMKIQEYLSLKGHYKSIVDGIYGKGTNNALQKYLKVINPEIKFSKYKEKTELLDIVYKADQLSKKCLNINNPFKSDNKVKVLFENNLGVDVEVFWIDFTGNPNSYGTYKRNKIYGMNTFLTHSFKFISKKTKNCLGFKTIQKGDNGKKINIGF